MKRHHIVAAFLLICGGLFAYIRFENGDTNGAIRTGIIFTLLAIIMFFLGRLQPRLRSLGVNLVVLIFLGISAYRDFMAGDIGSVIILGILMILGIVLTLFQDTPFVKKKIGPWLKPITYRGGRSARCAHCAAAFTLLGAMKRTPLSLLPFSLSHLLSFIILLNGMISV